MNMMTNTLSASTALAGVPALETKDAADSPAPPLGQRYGTSRCPKRNMGFAVAADWR